MTGIVAQEPERTTDHDQTPAYQRKPRILQIAEHIANTLHKDASDLTVRPLYNSTEHSRYRVNVVKNGTITKSYFVVIADPVSEKNETQGSLLSRMLDGAVNVESSNPPLA